MQAVLNRAVLSNNLTYAGTIYGPVPKASTRSRGGRVAPATSAGLCIFLENLHLYAEVPVFQQGGGWPAPPGGTPTSVAPGALAQGASHLDPFFFSKIQGVSRNFLI